MRRRQAHAVKFTKKQLIELLADDRVRRYPDLYRGHREDAVYYWEHHGGALADLLTAAVAHGLVSNETAREFEGRRHKRRVH